ncbi:MAG: hemopexin repeat-containing protein [Actinomycetota bacterium]
MNRKRDPVTGKLVKRRLAAEEPTALPGDSIIDAPASPVDAPAPKIDIPDSAPTAEAGAPIEPEVADQGEDAAPPSAAAPGTQLEEFSAPPAPPLSDPSPSAVAEPSSAGPPAAALPDGTPPSGPPPVGEMPPQGPAAAAPSAPPVGPPAAPIEMAPESLALKPSHRILTSSLAPLPGGVAGPIPGLELVGRGVTIRPNQPYELRSVLFARTENQSYYSRETGETFILPVGYEVNDSPPMPANQMLNQTIVEESWERFEKQLSFDASLAASHLPVTIDVSASRAEHLRRSEDAYYATRTSFIPLYSLYIPSTQDLDDWTEGMDIPVPFSHRHRRAYAAFFERFGTHYIRRAWVGGKATLALTVKKSSELTKEDITAGLQATYAGVGSGKVDTARSRQRDRLANNSECSVLGKGGDELMLASLSSLDEAQYQAWLSTVKSNPQVIEFEAVGIWTLIKDEEKAAALMTAYREETSFQPIRVVFNIDREIFVLGERDFFTYRIDESESTLPRPIEDAWPGLAKVGFEHVDAGFVGKYMYSVEGEDLSRKLFFFNRDKYLRWDIDAKRVDKGYPKLISEGWPGVTFDRLDAVVNVAPDALYFFKGREYIRFNTLNNHADQGYPDLIAKRWVGVTFDRLDAAVYWGNAKIYFFRGDQLIRYDTVLYQSDPGYPKQIFSNYVEDWRFIE